MLWGCNLAAFRLRASTNIQYINTNIQQGADLPDNDSDRPLTRAPRSTPFAVDFAIKFSFLLLFQISPMQKAANFKFNQAEVTNACHGSYVQPRAAEGSPIWADHAQQPQHEVQVLSKTSKSGASFTLWPRISSAVLSGIKRMPLATLLSHLQSRYPFSIGTKFKFLFDQAGFINAPIHPTVSHSVSFSVPEHSAGISCDGRELYRRLGSDDCDRRDEDTTGPVKWPPMPCATVHCRRLP
ncbi:hypothetical protein B0H14DRAFT_3737251 [Mycena olivaceomarginata]|nr:hypothetical protein B0H14DRAFT_3737251 [Mycena olivaceomarginata]